jgi:hypothetical protein
MDETDAAIAAQLRRDWFTSINELADIDLQRRRWREATGWNPHWSYVAFVSSFPDQDELAEARARGWLNAGEFRILRELLLTLVEHEAPGGDDFDHVAILNDPAWHDVVEAARIAKQELLAVVSVAGEREALEGGPASAG